MLTILLGDVLEQLATLPDESVQCVVTSPPYWGLRDYGTPGQIGLEKTPELYVEKMVAVFREVKRVLRDDGTIWVNLGDSYARNSGGDSNTGPSDSVKNHVRDNGLRKPGNYYKPTDGMKPKDLVGIPWRVAFALQADGWYLRSDIIWAKPNPMPESVTDRPTKAHEYIFLLSKRERYFFDQDAVREPGSDWHSSRFDDPRDLIVRPSTGRGPRRAVAQHKQAALGQNGGGYLGSNDEPQSRNIRSVWNLATQPYPDAHFATFPEELPKRCILAGTKAGDVVLDPFAGSGTTLKVALELGRQAIGIELNKEYAKMIDRRCQTTMGLAF